MNTPPNIPLPKDPRHQRYCDNLLAGMSGVESYQRAYSISTPKLTRESAYVGDQRIKKRSDVIAYLSAIRAASASASVLSLADKREFLARVVRTDITTLSIDGDSKNGDMIKSYSISESESARNIRIEKHDPLKAIDLDNRIAGEDPATNLLSDLALALQSLPKPTITHL